MASEVSSTPEVSVAETPAEAPKTAPVQVNTVDVPRPRKRKGQRGWRKPFVATHRWVSLGLGLLLLVITTSGALLLYRPEIFRAEHPNLYHSTPTTTPIGFQAALDAVNKAYPKGGADSVQVDHGVDIVSINDDKTWAAVDPGTGKVNGAVNLYAGPLDWSIGFLDNLHECFLTCYGMPGYIHYLNAKVPSLGWNALGELTWGSVLLGVVALALLFLVFGGLMIWWPRRRGLKKALVIERGRTGLLRHRQLHQVVGMAALPLLFMWGLTGANFEFPFVAKAWYAALPGAAPSDAETSFASVKGKGPDIGVDRAAAAAAKALGGGRVEYLELPDKSDQTATYSFYVGKGVDPWRHSLYPGNVGIDVDRRTGATKVVDSPPGEAESRFLESFGDAFHRGYPISGWWRSILFAFGMAPLLMAVTGFFMWRHKRRRRVEGKKRRKELARAKKAASPEWPDAAVTLPA